MSSSVVAQQQQQQRGSPAGMGPATLAASYPMASLYVGDLDLEVTEATLFEKFSQAGPVLSIRVCRDAVSRRSLGYAYVNFQQPADAERALDTMNFDALNNQPMRIMWSQRDPASRRSGVGNIFIKNLEKNIDNKSIYDTFSTFGHISSCKVAIDEGGKSKGYAFVHFDTAEAATQAIEKVNGMLLQGKKVFVGQFVARDRRQRELGFAVSRFTNCFVKNFAQDIQNDQQLKALFDKFGTVLSAKVMLDDGGVSKGFGFVSFEKPEEAQAAVGEMNGKEIGERKLYVGRAQKRSERSAEMKRKYEVIKQEKLKQYQGANLYVKNLDEELSDEVLRDVFAAFGNISSCKVMRDESGRSKGFGFVCFTNQEEATKAMTEMYGKMVGKKPLYVAPAQRLEERKSHLANLYLQRLNAMRLANGVESPSPMFVPQAVAPAEPIWQMLTNVCLFCLCLKRFGRFVVEEKVTKLLMQSAGAGAMFAPTAGGYFTTPAVAVNRPSSYLAQFHSFGVAPAPAPLPPQSPNIRPAAAQTPRWAPAAYQRAVAAAYQQQAPSQQQQQFYGQPNRRGRFPGRPAGVVVGQQQQQTAVQQRPALQQVSVVHGQQQPRIQQVHPLQSAPAQQQQNAVRFSGAEYTDTVQMLRSTNQALQVLDQPLITAAELANAPAQEQKQMLGERIYPLIEKGWGQHVAGKVTGMLLEMDNSELLIMLTDETMLRNKVEEAITVLKAHRQASEKAHQDEGQSMFTSRLMPKAV